jgi:hypothetical protein
VIDNPPPEIGVNHSKFVAMCTDARHRSRVGQNESFALLQATKQETRLTSRRGTERRRLDFALEPDEWLVRFALRKRHMSNMTYHASGDQSFVSRGSAATGSHTAAELGPHDYRPIRSVTAISMETSAPGGVECRSLAGS